ncbi:uncharacterized protein LOC135399587 [Ornithodoros turicata]|uniref:uncharacterized protein LOC135399587 n=1 Tax=Ornithodoros turicata TaxID=34597 RepID=UPI0031389CC3
MRSSASPRSTWKPNAHSLSPSASQPISTGGAGVVPSSQGQYVVPKGFVEKPKGVKRPEDQFTSSQCSWSSSTSARPADASKRTRRGCVALQPVDYDEQLDGPGEIFAARDQVKEGTQRKDPSRADPETRNGEDIRINNPPAEQLATNSRMTKATHKPSERIYLREVAGPILTMEGAAMGQSKPLVTPHSKAPVNTTTLTILLVSVIIGVMVVLVLVFIANPSAATAQPSTASTLRKMMRRRTDSE